MANENNPTRRAGDTGATEEVAAIPLVEERISISKRQVESGRLRVHVTIEDRAETVAEQLSRDDVEIEHIPRNVRLTEMPHVRHEGTTMIIPVVEEVAVIDKALVLVEEIHIRRRTTSESVEIPVTLRSERAKIERDNPGTPPAE